MPIDNIANDGLLEIAVGRSRGETRWKNKEFLWSELVKKLSVTHRTHETHAEYMVDKKSRQDEIKDIGGFVGGYITGGRRKSNNILHRQLITLDIDFSNSHFWEDFVLCYDNAALLYSTHKHSSTAPRLRLVMPLDRPVRPDEYEAISRRIAGILDIEVFDPTTFQPERLMYWPSTSADAEYLFEWQDGPWICADNVLNSYKDWQDSSQWPVSSKIDKLVKRGMAKQGDPLDKPGVVGAFCRTYTIHEAIEKYLDDVYASCAIENRYSYKEGSTAAGLITYDDKFAFSHHGSDPVSGKLCNAFDLVRIHLFGLKDENVKEGTPGNKMPSYLAMIDLATQDPEVKKILVSEKIEGAKADFKNVDEDPLIDDAVENDEWKEKLDVDRKGNIYGTIDNILLILENDGYFKNKIAYDDFEKCEVAIRDLPWRKVDSTNRRLIDKDDSNIRHYLEKIYGISNMTKTRDAMEVLANKATYHPVRDYLSSLTWDGIGRVDNLLVDYQGAEDNEYTKTVIRKMLVAAVARVFRPGVKFDHVLVLVGEQGKKKSSLIAALGKQWFSDSFSTIEGKESFEQLQGVWLVEIAELAGLAKAEVEKIKHFITKRDDRYRVAFGRRVEKFPRQCVFFATTNKLYFLKDPSGDRRYWPVRVNVKEPAKDVFKMDDCEIDQIWAEAMQLYKKGEKLYLNEEMTAIAKKIQGIHTEEHPWTGLIQYYLDVKLPANWNELNVYERRNYLSGSDELQPVGTINRTRVCIHEIWEEAIRGKDVIDQRNADVIRNIMARMEGWIEEPKPMRYGRHGRQRKGYMRVEIPVEFDANFVDDLRQN